MSAGAAAASVDFTVSILGEAHLQRALQGRIRATSDLSPAFRRMADDFEDQQKKRFAREGAVDGASAWEPLDPEYAAWKEEHYPGAKILHLSGDLEKALTGGAGSTREIGPLRMVVGGTIQVGRWDLGALHFTGTRHMPARRPIAIGRQQRHRWMRFLVDHLRVEGRLD